MYDVQRKKNNSILTNSNFPYETTRGFNNMTIDLEEAENIKNKVTNAISETNII
jgi:hypothetical protein